MGAAYGVGLALGTTVIFIFLVQLTKGLGSNGLIPPEFAAWTPSIVLSARRHPVRQSAHDSSVQQNVLTHRRRGYFLRDIGRGMKEPATYGSETIRQMRNIGVDSLPLTAIVAAFIGAVTAFQTRYQLFGGVQLSVVGLISRQSIVFSSLVRCSRDSLSPEEWARGSPRKSVR